MTITAVAARLVEHGAPLRVEQTELADPGPGEVRVDLSFGGVNPVDRYQAEGRVAAELALPRTLGGEASGRVGGRAVMVRGSGLWASAAVVPEGGVVPLPAGVDERQAAAMGIAGLTAWRVVVERAEVGPDDRVLVLGAAGGVGSIACSIAHHLGARVCGQTGQADKSDFVRLQGADEVVVGGADDLEAATAAFAPTVVLDPLGDGFTAAAIAAIEPFGRIVLYGVSAGDTAELPLRQLYRKNVQLLTYGGLIEPEERMRPALEAALAALADGRLSVPIDSVVPLERVNDAFQQLSSRQVRGNLVLDLRAG